MFIIIISSLLIRKKKETHCKLIKGQTKSLGDLRVFADHLEHHSKVLALESKKIFQYNEIVSIAIQGSIIDINMGGLIPVKLEFQSVIKAEEIHDVISSFTVRHASEKKVINKAHLLRAEVLQNYEAQNPRELSLRKYQIVIIIKRKGTGKREGFWKGDLNGTEGWFPKEFVLLLFLYFYLILII